MQQVHEVQDGDRRVEGDVVRDEVRHDEGVAQLARLIALAGGAVVTILGLIALIGIDWGSSELAADAPVTEVAGMPFTPVVAGATTFLGLLLLLAAASRSGEGRVAMGAITASLGAAIVLADLRQQWNVEDAQGWILLVVGVVTVLTGMVDRGETVVSRRHDRVIDIR